MRHGHEETEWECCALCHKSTKTPGRKRGKENRRQNQGRTDGCVYLVAWPCPPRRSRLRWGPPCRPVGGHKQGERTSVTQVSTQRPHEPVDILMTSAHDFPLPCERKKTLFRQATFASTPTTLTPTLLGPSTLFPLQGPCNASTSSDFCTWSFCVCLFVYLIEDPAEHLQEDDGVEDRHELGEPRPEQVHGRVQLEPHRRGEARKDDDRPAPAKHGVTQCRKSRQQRGEKASGVDPSECGQQTRRLIDGSNSV